MQATYEEFDLSPPTTTRTTFKSWVVCLTAGLFFFYEFFQLNMLNTLEPYLMSTFAFDAQRINHMSAYYFYAEILFLFPAGLLLDRVSVRRLVLISMMICVLGTYGFSIAQNYWQCALFRFMEGLGAALCLLSSLKLSSRWFHPKHMALITGILVTMAMVGGMLAQTPLQHLVMHWGWRKTIAYDAYIGIVFIIMIYLWVKDYPKGHRQRFLQEQVQLSMMGFFESILLAAKEKQTWLAGLYTCLMNLPIFLLGALNGTLFLTQVYGLSTKQASTASSMVFFGCVVGSPLAGFISDLLGLRRWPMVVGAFLSLAAVMPLLLANHLNFVEASVLLFVIGLITSTQVLSYPLVTESNPIPLTGTALSIASLLIMSGGAIFQPLFGYLLSLNWKHQTDFHGIAQYTVSDYRTGFSILPIAFLISLVLCLFIRETHCMPYTKGKKYFNSQ